MESIRDRAALGWVRHMDLDTINDGVARLRVRPNVRDVLAFMNDKKKSQLAELLGQAVGTRVKVEVIATDPASPTTVTNAPQPTTDATPGQPADSPVASNPRPSTKRISSEERDTVMRLPAVRQVLEVFDATLIDVRLNQKPAATKQDQPTDPQPSESR